MIHGILSKICAAIVFDSVVGGLAHSLNLVELKGKSSHSDFRACPQNSKSHHHQKGRRSNPHHRPPVKVEVLPEPTPIPSFGCAPGARSRETMACAQAYV